LFDYYSELSQSSKKGNFEVRTMYVRMSYPILKISSFCNLKQGARARGWRRRYETLLM